MRPLSTLTACRRLTAVNRFRSSTSPSFRLLHNSASLTATPLPHPIAAGPPPQPPQATASETEERVARKRQQAALLERQSQVKANPAKPLQKRFWKETSVKEGPDGLQILLDKRPVRTATKEILTLPLHKVALASGIALEWDLLVSAQQALKYHYIPLTSLSSRAMDIQKAETRGDRSIRESIIKVMMRYLGTDTLLCWDPEKNVHDMGLDMKREGSSKKTLRQKQVETAESILAHLTTHIFPGLEIVPILGEESIMPIAQPQETQDVIRAWMSSLCAFDLAGLERGVLATKSLLVAIRLVVEWSQELGHAQRLSNSSDCRFGISEASEASRVEVTWQTDMWGEVEDSHDVDKEDVARQLGSVILLVS